MARFGHGRQRLEGHVSAISAGQNGIDVLVVHATFRPISHMLLLRVLDVGFDPVSATEGFGKWIV